MECQPATPPKRKAHHVEKHTQRAARTTQEAFLVVHRPFIKSHSVCKLMFDINAISQARQSKGRPEMGLI